MSAETIPESIRKAAYIIASDIRHHIAHSEIELIKNDPDVTSMVAKSIHDAVMAEREKHAWQPIETAPKDGTRVLAGCFKAAAGHEDCVGHMSVDRWQEKYKLGFGHFNEFYWPATHWMPLPAAPNAEGK